MDPQPQTELARSVVSEIAPSELPLFEIMSRSFASNPKRVRIRRGGDEELGFGLAESAMLVTPVALAAIREIALFLAEDFAKALSHAAADAVAARITKLFRRESGTPPLTDTQIASIRNIVVEAAQTSKLGETQTTLLVDTLVTHLTKPPPSKR